MADADDADGSDSGQTALKEAIQELDYQGDVETLRRLTEESRQTLEHQLESLNDIDSKAIAILRVNVLLMGLLFTAASFVVESPFDLARLDNFSFYIGITSLLLSSALAALTYTASDTEVGIEGSKIDDVIRSDLSEEEFELAVAQSHTRWIWFNNRTNVINAPLITLTNILLIVAVSHLALGVYIALVDEWTVVITLCLWSVLGLFILASNILAQLRAVHEEIDIRAWRPW